MSEIRTRLINFTSSSLDDKGMNFFDEVLLPPHNTPESGDPFLTSLTAVADDMDGQTGQQPGPEGQPPFDDWAAADDLSFSDRTYMWQQNHYMASSAADPRVTESGFISGTTTQPPSASGHDEDMEGNFVGGPGSSIYNLDSMPQSGTNSSINVPPVDPEVFIPKLIESLSDPDRLISDTVLAQMVKFATKENFLQAILQSEQLVTLLVGVLDSTSAALCSPDDPEANPVEVEKTHERAKNVVKIINKMSDTIEGKKVIVLSGGIKGIATFLMCPVDRVMFLAIVTLHTLLLVKDEKNPLEIELCERVKMQVRVAGGSQALASLLARPDNSDKFNCIVIDCLRILAMKNAETKRIILEHNGPQLLVEIMLTNNYRRLLITTSRLLKVLSVCPKNKPAIIQAGGIDAIARGLTHETSQHDDMKRHCIWTLRNLSDAANNIRDLNTLLQTLVQLLNHPKDDLAICSAGILFNLTCNNSCIKQALCSAQGIPALVSIVAARGNNRELLEPAVGTLKHITNGHEEAEIAQRQLLHKCNALPMLKIVLEHHMRGPTGPHWPSVKAVLGLVRNLAQTGANQEMIRGQEVLTMTKRLLCFVHENYLVNPSPAVEGVRPDEIVSLILDCLYHMAKDGINRSMLRDPDLTHVLGQLARPVCGGQQKFAARCLYELSFDAVCASCMHQNPTVVETIKALVNTESTEVAKFALGIMQNLSRLQREPLEQMQNMSQPMMQNQLVTDMFPGGSQGQFPPPPHMQQQQQRRFQGQPQYQQQQQMQGMQQGGGFDMVQQQQQQQQQQQPTGPPHPSFGGGGRPAQGSTPYMDQSNDFPDIGDLMSPDFGFAQQEFYDDSMS